jgi:hypothetical protein
MEQLRSIVRSHPVIDNHCHNILRDLEHPDHELESMVSDGSGLALQQSSTSLANLRAAQDLKTLYGLDETKEYTWDELRHQRSLLIQRDSAVLISTCFSGIRCMLIDDGFLEPDDLQPYDWHSQFTYAPAKRIFRIEAEAEDILYDLLPKSAAHENSADYQQVWNEFTEYYKNAIVSAIMDPQVVGFKSVICYRSGLRMTCEYASSLSAANKEAQDFIARCVRDGDVRFDSQPLNDYLVLQTFELLLHTDSSHKKPFQFHTGFGMYPSLMHNVAVHEIDIVMFDSI